MPVLHFVSSVSFNKSIGNYLQRYLPIHEDDVIPPRVVNNVDPRPLSDDAPGLFRANPFLLPCRSFVRSLIVQVSMQYPYGMYMGQATPNARLMCDIPHGWVS